MQGTKSLVDIVEELLPDEAWVLKQWASDTTALHWSDNKKSPQSEAAWNMYRSFKAYVLKKAEELDV